MEHLRKLAAKRVKELKSQNREPTKQELSLLGIMIVKEKLYNLKTKFLNLRQKLRKIFIRG